MSSDFPTIPWTEEVFPRNGAGRVIEIIVGGSIRFKSNDNQKHNIAEARLLDDESDSCGSINKVLDWVPLEKPVFNLNITTRRDFDETLTFNRCGTHYFVSPIGTQHKIIRLKVIVYPESVFPTGMFDSVANDQADQDAKAAKTSQDDQDAKADKTAKTDQDAKADKTAKTAKTAKTDQGHQSVYPVYPTKPAQPSTKDKLVSSKSQVKVASRDEDNIVPSDHDVKNLLDKIKNIDKGIEKNLKKTTWSNLFDVSAYFNVNKPIGPLGPKVN